MRRFFLAMAALAALLAPVQAGAWGAYAHRQTATIALANVSPEVRAKIRALLAREKEMGTPQCPLKTLEDAAVWADCVRGEGWRWGYTAAWHYRTAPICEVFDPRSNCAGGNCVTAQITRAHKNTKARKELASKLSAMGSQALQEAYVAAKGTQGDGINDVADLSIQADKMLETLAIGLRMDEENGRKREAAHAALSELKGKLQAGFIAHGDRLSAPGRR